MTTLIALDTLESANGYAAPAERRSRTRFRLACPIRLWVGDSGRVIEAWTGDISCQGFSLVSPVTLRVGEVLDCELMIGADPSAGAALLTLRCDVEVVRCDRSNDSGTAFDLGCRLLRYSAADGWPMLPV